MICCTLSLTSSCIVRLTFHKAAESSPSDMVNRGKAQFVTPLAGLGWRELHASNIPHLSSFMAPPNTTNGVASLPLTNALMVTHEHLITWATLTWHSQTKLKPAKIFKAAVEPAPPLPPGSRTPAPLRHITGLSFDDRGDQVITAAEDETFRLYNCKTGKQVPV